MDGIPTDLCRTEMFIFPFYPYTILNKQTRQLNKLDSYICNSVSLSTFKSKLFKILLLEIYLFESHNPICNIFNTGGIKLTRFRLWALTHLKQHNFDPL